MSAHKRFQVGMRIPDLTSGMPNQGHCRSSPHTAWGDSGVCKCIHARLAWAVFPAAFKMPITYRWAGQNLHIDSPVRFFFNLNEECTWRRNRLRAQPWQGVEPGPLEWQPGALTTALLRPRVMLSVHSRINWLFVLSLGKAHFIRHPPLAVVEVSVIYAWFTMGKLADTSSASLGNQSF